MLKIRSIFQRLQDGLFVRSCALACACLIFTSLSANAQLYSIFPASPSSADNIIIQVRQDCSVFVANPYTVKSSGNRISVALGEARYKAPCGTPPPPITPLAVEIGRLPAGEYLLDIIQYGGFYIAKDLPLLVSDDRVNKTAPYVWRDVSGHWWNPEKNGEGFLIWQDKKSDQFMVAWFTYDANGRPQWYTIQDGKWESGAVYVGKLYYTERIQSAGALVSTVNGTARLSFGSAGEGPDKAYATITNGGTTMNFSLTRFKP